MTRWDLGSVREPRRDECAVLQVQEPRGTFVAKQQDAVSFEHDAFIVDTRAWRTRALRARGDIRSRLKRPDAHVRQGFQLRKGFHLLARAERSGEFVGARRRLPEERGISRAIPLLPAWSPEIADKLSDTGFSPAKGTPGEESKSARRIASSDAQVGPRQGREERADRLEPASSFRLHLTCDAHSRAPDARRHCLSLVFGLWLRVNPRRYAIRCAPVMRGSARAASYRVRWASVRVARSRLLGRVALLVEPPWVNAGFLPVSLQTCAPYGSPTDKVCVA